MTRTPSRSRHKRSGVESPECSVATPKTGSLPELPSIPHFHAITGQDPYPWQRRLYRRFLTGEVPQAVAIPTGLGKTSSVLLALLARLANPSLPRRVVHIVDRRALVDQAAETVRAWIERIGTLPELARAFERLAAFPGPRPGRTRGAARRACGRWRVAGGPVPPGGHRGDGRHGRLEAPVPGLRVRPLAAGNGCGAPRPRHVGRARRGAPCSGDGGAAPGARAVPRGSRIPRDDALGGSWRAGRSACRHPGPCSP